MNVLTIVGACLTVVGIVGIVYGGITYTSAKDVVDLGPLHVEVDQQRRIPITPLAGAVVLLFGAILMFVGKRHLARGKIV
ncbi:MAG: DUF3185 domain-containing protein [bacterium]|nr:DUF3185 domain-containing protein [bacterium]